MARISINATTSVIAATLGVALWLSAVLQVFGRGKVFPDLAALVGVVAFYAGVIWLVKSVREHFHIYAPPMSEAGLAVFFFVTGIAFFVATIRIIVG